MDLSQYAELFLAESREHLSACNQLLLEWERNPAAPEPVVGIFRAVHTVKGMAATMGYGRVADLAHRMENLLDQLRRGGQKPSDDTIQLLFRATDALEKAVGLAVAGRERELDFGTLPADLERVTGKEPKPSPAAESRAARPSGAGAPAAAAPAAASPAAAEAHNTRISSPAAARNAPVSLIIQPLNADKHLHVSRPPYIRRSAG